VKGIYVGFLCLLHSWGGWMLLCSSWVVHCVWGWTGPEAHAVNQRDWKNNSLALASIPLLWRTWRLTMLQSLRSYHHMAAFLCDNMKKKKGKTQGLLKLKYYSNNRQWYLTTSLHYVHYNKHYCIMQCYKRWCIFT